jgi:hypothetical protein
VVTRARIAQRIEESRIAASCESVLGHLHEIPEKISTAKSKIRLSLQGIDGF